MAGIVGVGSVSLPIVFVLGGVFKISDIDGESVGYCLVGAVSAGAGGVGVVTVLKVFSVNSVVGLTVLLFISVGMTLFLL